MVPERQRRRMRRQVGCAQMQRQCALRDRDVLARLEGPRPIGITLMRQRQPQNCRFGNAPATGAETQRRESHAAPEENFAPA